MFSPTDRDHQKPIRTLPTIFSPLKVEALSFGGRQATCRYGACWGFVSPVVSTERRTLHFCLCRTNVSAAAVGEFWRALTWKTPEKPQTQEIPHRHLPRALQQPPRPFLIHFPSARLLSCGRPFFLPPAAGDLLPDDGDPGLSLFCGWASSSCSRARIADF